MGPASISHVSNFGVGLPSYRNQLAQFLDGAEDGPLSHALHASSQVSLHVAFEGLSPKDQEKILRQMGRAELNELWSIEKETDPELLLSELLALGNRLEEQDRLESASSLFSLVAATDAFPKLQGKARLRYEAILGKGAFGPRFEFLFRRVSKDATDYRMIVPMMAGTVVAGFVRSTALAKMAGVAGESWFSSGVRARWAAGALAFAAEVPTFALTGRALRSGEGSKKETNLGQDLASAALTLGLLKLYGHAGEKTLANLHGVNTAGAPSRLLPLWRSSQAFIPPLAMFGGLLTAHRAEVALGWRPNLDGATIFTDTLASMVSMGVGGRLGTQFLGSGFATYSREWGIRAELAHRNLEIPSRTTRGFPGLGLAAAAGGLSLILLPRLAEAATLSASVTPSTGGAYEWLLGLGIGACFGVCAYRQNPHREILHPLENHEVLARDANDLPRTLQLNGDQVVQENTLPMASEISLELEQGRYYVDLARDQVLGGIPFYRHSKVELDLTGRPQSVRLPSLPWKENAFLGNAYVVQGRLFLQGSKVHFDAEGRFSRVRLSGPQWIDGMPCSEREDVTFHPNGRLASLVLARAAKVGRNSFSAGTELKFDESGKWIASREEVVAVGQGVVHSAHLRNPYLTSVAYLGASILAHWLQPVFGGVSSQLLLMLMAGYGFYKISNRLWEQAKLKRSGSPQDVAHGPRLRLFEPASETRVSLADPSAQDIRGEQLADQEAMQSEGEKPAERRIALHP